MSQTVRPIAPVDAHSKALALNLDPSSYGTIAEIGAGQEVARYFLTVGGASGTVAQTISAYDKTFSDATYGAGTRYVSRERLIAMLDHEFRQLIERLGAERGTRSRFFAFADTASARNYRGDNEQHAWIGLRFQTVPGGPPSTILLHANLIDSTATLQQQALGVLGVNLIHTAFFRWGALPEEILAAVWDELSLDQLELDVVELNGPAFDRADANAISLKLIRAGMGRAIAFDTNGGVVEPASLLRKRPLIVERRLLSDLETDPPRALRASEAQLQAEGVVLERDPLGVFELSLDPQDVTAPDDATALAGIQRLTPHGPVIVSGYSHAYALADYLRRFTLEPIRLVVGTSVLARLLEERLGQSGSGEFLEVLGKLFSRNVKVHAYPVPRSMVLAALDTAAQRFQIDGTGDDLVTADQIHPPQPVDDLYRYLRVAGWVLPVALG